MEPKNALPTIVDGSNRSMQNLSLAMHRSRNYLANVILRGTCPQIDTMAEIADVCGYDLMLRKRSDGSEIIIDPPEKE